MFSQVKWTKQHDTMLTEEMRARGTQSVRNACISLKERDPALFGNFTVKAMTVRYSKFRHDELEAQSPGPSQKVGPMSRRDKLEAWTANEDLVLVHEHQAHPRLSMKAIATAVWKSGKLPGRTRLAIRRRMNILYPSGTTRKCWTDAENEVIFRAHEEHPHLGQSKLARLLLSSKQLPGRTRVAIEYHIVGMSFDGKISLVRDWNPWTDAERKLLRQALVEHPELPRGAMASMLVDSGTLSKGRNLPGIVSQLVEEARKIPGYAKTRAAARSRCRKVEEFYGLGQREQTAAPAPAPAPSQPDKLEDDARPLMRMLALLDRARTHKDLWDKIFQKACAAVDAVYKDIDEARQLLAKMEPVYRAKRKEEEARIEAEWAEAEEVLQREKLVDRQLKRKD